MRLTAGAAALILSMTLPALLNEAGVDVPFGAPSAWAQDAITEVARQRYEEGVKAFDAGRFEDARSAFLQAYALKRHPAVLLNLGQSELKSNHPEDAGNHLQQFLREYPSATPDQRASAEKGIGDAKKKTAFIITIVDANGADVSLDGMAIGRAPLLDPYFAKPGKHTLVATYQGKSATVQVDAKAGVATAASLTLGTGGQALPAAVAPLPAAPTPSGTAQKPAPSPAAAPAYPPPAPVAEQPGQTGFSMGASAEPEQPTGSREPLFHWYKRKPIAWIGTGVAGVGLLGGVIFSIAAGSASSAADDHSAQIEAHARSVGDPLPVCGSIDSSGSDRAGYEKACDALRADFSDHDTDVAIATTGWVFFGLGVAGTAAYALIDWYPKKTTSDGSPTVSVAPIVSPTHKGLGVMGTF